MIEPPRITLGLDIPAQRILSSYVAYNEELERQTKVGIETALNKLLEDNNLAKIVEEEVYKTLRASFNNWQVQQMIENIFNEKLHQQLQNEAEHVADVMINKIKVTRINDFNG